MSQMIFKTEAERDAFIAQFKGKGRILLEIIRHSAKCSPTSCVCTPTYILEDRTNDPELQALRKQHKQVPA